MLRGIPNSCPSQPNVHASSACPDPNPGTLGVADVITVPSPLLGKRVLWLRLALPAELLWGSSCSLGEISECEVTLPWGRFFTAGFEDRWGLGTENLSNFYCLRLDYIWSLLRKWASLLYAYKKLNLFMNKGWSLKWLLHRASRKTNL